MPNSLTTLSPDPEMPELTDDLATAIAAEIKRVHGWEPLPWSVMITYNATRKVLEEMQS